MEDYWQRTGIEKPRQIVVCAANKMPDGYLILGARHWDALMRETADRLGYKGGDEIQGFINQFGEFLTREEALSAVLASGQRFDKERNGSASGKELFSEGLY